MHVKAAITSSWCCLWKRKISMVTRKVGSVFQTLGCKESVKESFVKTLQVSPWGIHEKQKNKNSPVTSIIIVLALCVFFSVFKDLFYMYMCVWWVYGSVYTGVFKKLKEGIRYFGAEVERVSELPCGWWDPKLQSSSRAESALRHWAISSLQPTSFVYLCNLFFHLTSID